MTSKNKKSTKKDLEDENKILREQLDSLLKQTKPIKSTNGFSKDLTQTYYNNAKIST